MGEKSQHLGVGESIVLTGGVKLPEPEKCARGPGMHRTDCGRHGGHSDGRLALRFAASGSSTSPRRLKRRQNQGQLAGSHSDVQRRLRLQPLAWEQPPYSLCTCVTRLCTGSPRTRTGSVAVTSRRQTSNGRRSERRFLLQQSRVTSSGRSQTT